MTARTKSAAVKMLMELVRVTVVDEEGLVGSQKRFVAAAHGRLGGKGAKVAQVVEEEASPIDMPEAPTIADIRRIVEGRRMPSLGDPWAVTR